MQSKAARGSFADPMSIGEAVQCKPVEVIVGDKGLDRAVKHLKRKMASEGILRELKRRRHYMKPSVRRRKKEAEAARREERVAENERLVALADRLRAELGDHAILSLNKGWGDSVTVADVRRHADFLAAVDARFAELHAEIDGLHQHLGYAND